MNNKPVNHYIVEQSALPKVLKDTVEVDRLLKNGKVKTISEALDVVGISRSSYYKYKDRVAPFNEITGGRIITLYVELSDEPGVLSDLLNIFAKAGMNILTLNQNIPIHSLAGITISARVGQRAMKTDQFIKKVAQARGVINIQILGRE